MSKLKINLKRRWVRSRPGSVLILVIALLVLLALIGTAYLSSTQTERYTSVQNTINTQADLLVQGLQTAVAGQIAGGLYGGSFYRPPQQEMATYPGLGAPTRNGYYNYVSTAIDPALGSTDTVPNLILADRIPITSIVGPAWNSISWPLFTDPSGSYTFDSPFDSSIQTFAAVHKGNIQVVPNYRSINGQYYPALSLYVTKSFTDSTGITTYAAGSYLNSTNTTPIVAASASGDGIADAGLFKLPVGQIDGITYYGAVRVVDGNSAVNVSSANSQGLDAPFTNVVTSQGANPATNFGMFRTNIGLRELFTTANAGSELIQVNQLRGFPTSFSATPNPNLNNFTWYSAGDEIDHQLTSRPGNPGSDTASQFNWFGQSITAALAYKYSLTNLGSLTTLESELPDLQTQSTAWSPSQVATWYQTNFFSFGSTANPYTGTNASSPVRTLLVGSNGVSNGVPAQYNSAAGTAPSTWTPGANYNFGDWVLDGPVGHQRSFVCIQQHTGASIANQPEPLLDASYNGYNTNATVLNYWAGAQTTPPVKGPSPGVPWHSVPVKTSINTATFEELWLGFAQVMTDRIAPDPGSVGGTPQWQPPMQYGTAVEPQMPQFRSTLRATTATPLKLTSSQMLKLRAALAAINTIDLRGGTTYNTTASTLANTVTSKRIILTDSIGNQAYEVEVFGAKPQPYITEMVGQVESQASNNFLAIELCNPYPYPMVLTNWAICTVDRSQFGTATGMNMSAPLAMDPTTPIITVPAATTSAGVTTPGIAVVASRMAPPAGVTLPASGLFICPTLASAIGMELVIVRPRAYDGTANTLSASANAADPYTENNLTAVGCADMVPVDQLDLTGMDQAAAGNPPARLQYRRGSMPALSPGGASYAWNFVYPGPYDPTVTAGTPRMQGIVIETGNKMSGGNLGAPDGGPPVTSAPTSASITYTTVPIQICNQYMGGPNTMDFTPSGIGSSKQFPFGGFARNLDMLQIPFIGSYRVRAITASTSMAAGYFTELNSLTMDSTLANDTTLGASACAATSASGLTVNPAVPNYLAFEQIGRFCPIGDTSGANPAAQLDFGNGRLNAGSTVAKAVNWHYHWAAKLFDYFSVQSPQDDYLPNVDPVKYPDATIPNAIGNNNSTTLNANIAGTSEETVGVEGLININTAPVPVLAQLPFSATDPAFAAGPAQQAQNAMIAQKIVDDRNANGPFKTIFDLYRVPAFRAENAAILKASPAPGPAQGIFSPGGISSTAAATNLPSGVNFDFSQNYILLNNISNLITTRSDTFTCYVLLQGWRNVGTGNPTLAVQRRIAFLVDRTNVTPVTNQPSVFNIPSQ